MKIKTIQNGNIIILILFLIVQLVMYFFPNSYERLKEKQETYAENGVSDIDNGWAYFLINEEFPLEKTTPLLLIMYKVPL